MRKRLLTATMALLCAVTGFAFEAGDYVLTKNQRFKITGENMIQNGDFSDALNGWHGDALTAAPSTAAWDVAEGEGPEGESVLKSLGNATEDAPFTGIVSGLDVDKSYVFTAMVKATDKFTTGTDVAAANCFSVFLTTGEEHLTKADGDSIVAAAVECAAGEWTQVAFYIVNKMGGNDASITRDRLVIYLNKLPKDVMITNIGLYEADEVYDIRILQKRIAYIRQLMAEPSFDTADAAEAKKSLQEVIAGMEEAIEYNGLDDISEGEGAVASLNEAFETFLDASSDNADSYINGINFAGYANTGRGGLTSNGNFTFGGGNWGKLAGLDNVMSAIQNGFANEAIVTIKNANLPAGKYFLTLEMRNANTGSGSWPCVPTFDLTSKVLMTFGDAQQVVTISGEEYQRFYMFANVEKKGDFEATIYWPGTSKGGAFYLRDVHVRLIGGTIEGQAEQVSERETAWNSFKAQYNAMVDAYNKSEELLADANYPWGKETLRAFKATWDPFYNKVIAKGWVDADGNDTGIATIDELNEFSTSAWGLTDNAPEGASDKYIMVRAYQGANNTFMAENTVVTAFAGEIASAKALMDNTLFVVGQDGKDALTAAITTAQGVLDGVIANTSDATRTADEETLNRAKATLEEAENAYKNANTLAPIVSIDFSNAPVAQTTEGIDGEGNPTSTETGKFIVKGAAGEMILPNYTLEGNDNNFSIGYNNNTEAQNVLRIGKGTAEVLIPEADQPAEDDVLRVQFDMWVGSLTRRYVNVQLQNAAGQRIAGFEFQRYNGTANYNDFNNEENTGMDLSKYVTGSSAGNAGSCVDGNKSSFDLIIDLKSQTVKGTITSKNGTCEGVECPIVTPANGDMKIAKFVVGSTYDNSGRRCWFDNLSILKYKSSASGPKKYPIAVSFKKDKYTTKVGDPFLAPTAVVEPAYSGVTITYSSSNSEIASVDATSGKVTALAAGTVTITATVAATKTYDSVSASYTLTITADAVKGDVNGNNEVDALDIQEVINAIIAGNNDAKYDVNGDNEVNALDIQEIINIIVGAQSK